MLKNALVAIVLCLAFLHFGNASTQAQTDPPKVEVNGHFSLINVQQPIFSGFSDERVSDIGLGGTLTYNLSRFVSLEAETNYFPRIKDNNFFLGPTNAGRKVQGLFGVKAGVRQGKIGIFGKFRPGFTHFSGIFDCPGANALDNQCGPHPKMEFTTDVGGVVEYYMTRHVMLRFDAGDTIIRFAKRQMFEVDLSDLPEPVRGKTTHNFQISAGIGYRF